MWMKQALMSDKTIPRVIAPKAKDAMQLNQVKEQKELVGLVR